jgi:NAD(P)-dependent dehydrogenase (short-subunit alcohol dehydrogenase family)
LDGAKSPVLNLIANEKIVGGIELSNAGAVETAVQQLREERNDIVGLINLVGAFKEGTLADTSSETLDWLFDSNVKSCFNLCKAIGPHLPKGGRIINVGAFAVGKASPGMVAYTTAKAALMELTQCYAAEMKETGITVNAILPSTIDTPRNRSGMPDINPSKWVRPEAIAQVLLFLLSLRAQCITGALIPVSNNAS